MQASVVVQTAVQRACAKGDLLVLQNLVDTEGLDILRFRFGKSKKTALHLSVEAGGQAFVKHLLKLSPLLVNEATTNGDTPLFTAIKRNNIALTRRLLKAKSDSSHFDSRGETPLMLASKLGYIEIVQLMVEEFKVSPEQRGDYTLAHHRTPIHNAAASGHVDVIEYFINHFQQTAESASSTSPCVKIQDRFKQTPLFSAVKYHRARVIQVLIANSADGFHLNNKGLTALHIAAGKGRLSTVSSFFLAIDDRDENAATPSNFSQLDSIAAVTYINMELAYAKASNGHIPLFSAVKYGHVDVVRFFVVNLGIDVNTKDIMGQTVLHFVATQLPMNKQSLELTQTLCFLGCDPEISDNQGRRPAMLFSSKSNFPVIFHFVNKLGIVLEAADQDGNNILHYAAQGSSSSLIHFLLDSASKEDIDLAGTPNKHGKLPSDLAAAPSVKEAFQTHFAARREERPPSPTDWGAMIEALPGGECVQQQPLSLQSKPFKLATAAPCFSWDLNAYYCGDSSSTSPSDSSEDSDDPSQPELAHVRPAKIRKCFPERAPNAYINAQNASLQVSTNSSTTSSLASSLSEWEIEFEELTIGGSLGSGSFGVVRKGEWCGTDVAIKWFHKQDSKSIKMFFKEVELMCKLRHPNVVRYMGVCTKEPNLCMVMEYIPRSLSSLLKEQAFEYELTLSIARGVARGMQYLHRRNIIHRDIKTSNVLVDEHMIPKIADFGVSRMSKGTVATMTGIGTPLCMAPEMLRTSKYGPKVDVYAFALLLWQMTTAMKLIKGFPGCTGMEPLQVAFKVATEKLRPVIPASCPEPLQKLIVTLWDDDPDKRPAFSEVAKTLDTMISLSKQSAFPMKRKHADS